MAQKIQVILTCDIDESDVEAAQTVNFSYGGSDYAFELCEKHFAEFDGILRGYIASARKADGSRKPRRSAIAPVAAIKPTAGKEQLASIRDWARANGHAVSDRGRISAEIRTAYAAANT